MRVKSGCLMFGVAVSIALAGCSTPPETDNDQWGNDVRNQDVDIKRDPGRRISFSDEVDVMRDVDERQKW